MAIDPLHDQPTEPPERRLSPAEEARLVRENMGLVYRIAHKFKRSARFDELIQEGTIGLLIGIRKFDPERGFTLSTYVSNWIRSRIYDHIGFAKRVVVTKSLLHNTRTLIKAQRAVEARGQEPTPEAVQAELSKTWKWGVDRVAAHLTWWNQSEKSIDLPPSPGESRTLGELLVAPGEDIEELVDRHTQAERFAAAVETFERSLSDDRERDVFGVMMDRGETMPMLAKRYGVSRQRMEQIQRKLERRFSVALRFHFGKAVDVKAVMKGAR